MKTNLGLMAFAVLVAVGFLALGAGTLGVFADSPLLSNPRHSHRPTLVAPAVVVTPDRGSPASRQAACDVPPECAG